MKGLNKAAAVAIALGMLVTSVPTLSYAEAATTAITQDQAEAAAKKAYPIPEGYKLQSVDQGNQQYGPYGNQSIWGFNWVKQEPDNYHSIRIVINAKTSEILNLDIGDKMDPAPFEDSITREQALDKAMDWLKKLAPDKLSQIKETQIPNNYYGPPGDVMQTFRFVRYVNGVPYNRDGITITIDGKGNLRSYNFSWADATLVFPKADAAVSLDKASALYRDKLPIELQYMRFYKRYGGPTKELSLVYGFKSGNAQIYGGGMGALMVDATTGELLNGSGAVWKDTPTVNPTPLTSEPGKAPANGKIDKETATSLVSNYVSVDGYTLESSGYYEEPEQRKMWTFEYSQGDKQKPETMKHISVRIDAQSGELVNMYQYSNMGPNQQPDNTNSFPFDQAKTTALDFVKKAIPTKTNKLVMMDYQGPDEKMMPGKFGPGYNFGFYRIENGIPVRDGGVNVTVDGKTGKVMQFNQNWQDDVTIPDAKSVIALEQAKDLIYKKQPLVLQYMPTFAENKSPYEQSAQNGVKLVYAPLAFDQNLLDAVSGEWLSPWGDENYIGADVTDIKGHWAEKQLKYFVDRGFLQVKEGKVSPDTVITKGEAIKLMVLALDGPRYMPESASFKDVAKGSDYSDFVESALYRKWIDKTEEFHPEANISRAELADIAIHALGYAKLSQTKDTFISHFTDVNQQSKYFGDISIISALGVMTGDHNQFHADRNVSRAETVVVITRLMDQLKGNMGGYHY